MHRPSRSLASHSCGGSATSRRPLVFASRGHRRGSPIPQRLVWGPPCRPWCTPSSQRAHAPPSPAPQARIKQNGTDLVIGDFEDELEAARAYDAKARELHGDRAFLNFPLK